MSTRQKLYLQKARPADCRDVWLWRNDPVTRAHSLTSRRISYPRHKKWFSEVLKNRRRALYIVSQGGRKLGVVRFDFGEDSVAEISVNIRPEDRGRGLGKKILKLADRLLRRGKKKSIQKAIIKKGNAASEKAFAAAGFKKISIVAGRGYSIWIKP